MFVLDKLIVSYLKYLFSNSQTQFVSFIVFGAGIQIVFAKLNKRGYFK